MINFVDSNYEDADIDSIKSPQTCIKPDKVASESNCHCYNKPETDFEYTICKEPKKG